MERCNKTEKCNSLYEHFVENDYVDDMQNKLLGLPVKRKLKKFSILNVNLSFRKSENQMIPRSERR